MTEVGINTLAMVAASLTAIVASETQKLHKLIERFHEANRAGKPLDAHDIINEITATKTNLFQAASDAQSAVNDVAKSRLDAAKETEPEIKVPIAPEIPMATTETVTTGTANDAVLVEQLDNRIDPETIPAIASDEEQPNAASPAL